MARERDADKRYHRGDEYGREDQVARHLQGANAIGEDKRRENVEGRLLGHTDQGRQDDITRLLLDHFDDWRVFDLLVRDQLLEHRRLEDAEPYPQPDPD